MQAKILVLVGFVCLGPAAVWAQLPIGPEFQANTFTTSIQTRPRIAADSVGNFVVVWQSFIQDAGALGYGVFGQRYDNAGAALGGEFLVNTYTTNSQTEPAVAAAATGEFVVVWNGESQDGFGSGIFGKRYDANGMALGAEFQLNSYTTSSQSTASVAIDGADRLIAVWSSPQDGSSDAIVGRRYDGNGVPLGGEFQVNTWTTGRQADASVAADAAGNFIVAWSSQGQDGSSYGVFARRYNSAGVPQGAEFQLNTHTTDAQSLPTVAADPSGDFVVVWQSASEDGDGTGIFGRRYDGNGMALGGEFQVNTYTTGNQSTTPVAVATDPEGAFVVVWRSAQDGSSGSVVGKYFDDTGAASGGEFQVNTYTTGDQRPYGVAVDGAGRFAVIWDGNYDDVFGRRFALPATHLVLGRRMVIKDPTGNEVARATTVVGREVATDVGPTIVGDPTASGATLRVITNGDTPSDQTFVLDADGWSPLATGYAYSGPTGADGDPVQKVLLKRTPAGTALVKVVLKGRVGIQPLNVVPPNLGTGGGIALTIGGAARYCVAFGGAAAGSIVADTPAVWKVLDATGEACPSP